MVEVGGPVAADTDPRLSAHLATCPECHDEWLALRDVMGALATGELAPAPDEPSIDLGFLEARPDPADASRAASGRWPRLGLLLALGLLAVALVALPGRLQRAAVDGEPGRGREAGAPGEGGAVDGDPAGEAVLGGEGEVDGARSIGDRSALARRAGEASPTVVHRDADRPSPLERGWAVHATATARRVVIDAARASATARAGTATARAPSPTPRPTPIPPTASPTATATATPSATAPPPPPEPEPTDDDSPDTIVICEPRRPGPIGGELEGSCPLFPAQSEFDAWRLRATERGRWRLATCGHTDLDTILALYPSGAFDPAAPCENLLHVDGDPAYDDDGCDGTRSELDLELDPGEYLLVVVEKSGDASAPYTLSVASNRTSARCPALAPVPSSTPATTPGPSPFPSQTGPAAPPLALTLSPPPTSTAP